MKKTLRALGIHFSAATILLGISLLINDYDGADQGYSLMLVMIGGTLTSIGGYSYLKVRKGIVIMILGVVILGIALFTF